MQVNIKIIVVDKIMALIGEVINYEGNNRNPITKFNTPESDLNQLFQLQIDEVVSMFGHDVLYLKIDDKSFVDIDMIFGELKTHLYKQVFEMRLYVEHGVEFGQNHQFAQMGFVLKDEMNFFISVKAIESIIGRSPLIGDIIYYIPAKRYFKVNYVNYESLFYVGHKYLQYQLKCVEYIKNEKTNFQTNDITINRIGDLNTSSNIVVDSQEVENVVDKTEKDPFGYFN